MSEVLIKDTKFLALEKVRKEMYQLTDKYGMHHVSVKKKSQELDKIILQIMSKDAVPLTN